MVNIDVFFLIISLRQSRFPTNSFSKLLLEKLYEISRLRNYYVLCLRRIYLNM